MNNFFFKFVLTISVGLFFLNSNEKTSLSYSIVLFYCM